MELLQTHDNSRTLIQCVTCKMYRDITQEEHESLLRSYNESQGECITKNCLMCRENKSLLTQIQDLNETIHKLNLRVTSLQEVRDCEESFDKTIEDIAAQLAGFHLNDSSARYESIPENQVPHPNGKTVIVQSEVLQITINTSVWDESTDHTFDSAGSSRLINPSLFTDKLNFVESSTQTEAGGKTSTSCTTQTDCPSQVTTVTQMQKTLTICNNKDTDEIIDVPENLCQSAVNSRTCCNWTHDIETLIVGEGSLIHFIFLTDTKKTFKIAKAGAQVCDLIDTAEFFLTAFPNLKTVLFHGGINGMRGSKTEVMKERYQRFIRAVDFREIKVILSGPCPYLLTSLEAFSRAFSINKWLVNILPKTDGLVVVDNFSSFWQKPNLFSTDCDELNREGCQVLQQNIIYAMQA